MRHLRPGLPPKRKGPPGAVPAERQRRLVKPGAVLVEEPQPGAARVQEGQPEQALPAADAAQALLQADTRLPDRLKTVLST